MKNPREVALKGLINLRRSGTWPDLFLKQESNAMTKEDGALCAEILYGTLENINRIDFYLEHFSTVKLKKVMPQVLDILRLTVYQLLFLDRVPHSAAVNEAIKLVKKYGAPGVSYANGILRTISVNKNKLPQVDKKPFDTYLSVEYSHPKWFAKEMIEELGEVEAEALFTANNQRAVTSARVNTLKTTTVSLLALLEKEGIEAEKCDHIPNAITFRTGFNPLSSKSFNEGLYYLQDLSSQLCVWALSPQKDSTTIDLCAAPGGKTLIAAQMMKNSGRIIAFDLHSHKIKLIEENRERYGATIIEPTQGDSTVFLPKYEGTADYILCDVPCSGMGIIRKKPDIRFKTHEEVSALAPLQSAILNNGAKYLKSGGTLVYSTCTVRKAENQHIIAHFLKEHPNFELVGFELPNRAVADGQITLYPHREGFDGFFIAKLRKKA